MARLQFSNTLRQARVNQFEVVVKPAPRLRIHAGPIPANVGAAETGLLLCEMDLPDNFMALSAGTAVKSGTWTGTVESAAGAGTQATHFRMISSDGVCHCQGDVSLSGGTGAMFLDDITLEAGQTCTVTQFNLVDGNA